MRDSSDHIQEPPLPDRPRDADGIVWKCQRGKDWVTYGQDRDGWYWARYDIDGRTEFVLILGFPAGVE
jgi:hypothetical protein